MKKLKKSIMLATALFMSTSALANEFHGYSDTNHNKHTVQKKHDNYQGYKNKKDRRSHIGDISRFFIGTVYNLNLSKKQELKIDKTIQEFKNKQFNQFNGFTRDGFDKQKFIDARKNAKEDKIKLKADLIEKIYHILNKEQISEMNKEIEIFKKMQEIETYKRIKKNRGQNDQYSNDRR